MGWLSINLRWTGPPESIAISPNGQNMCVALLTQPHDVYAHSSYTNYIAEFDLSALAKTNEIQIPIDPGDLALTDHGVLVVAGGSGQWTDLQTFQTADGSLLGTEYGVFMLGKLALHPAQDAVYLATTQLDPADIYRYDFDPTTGVFGSTWASPYGGNYWMGGVWCFPNGTNLVTPPGDIFSSSATQAKDLIYQTTLSGGRFAGVDFDPEDHAFFTVSATALCYYNLQAFELAQTLALPNGASYVHAAGADLFVVSVQNGQTLFQQYANPAFGVTTNQAGYYSVVVNNSYGVVTSAVAQVTILTPPGIARQPVSTNFLAGQNVWLSVLATGSAPWSYQWYFQGNLIGDATNATFEIEDVQAADDGVYRVAISNSVGFTNSTLARVRVLPAKPTIVANPSSLTVGAGSNAVFTVAAAGSEPLSYQWLFNGRAIRNATGAQLTLTDVQTANAGSYSAVVTNATGSATSKSATLTVHSAAPYFTVQPTSTVVLAGSTVTMSSQAAGSQPLNYQWYFQGHAVRNQNHSQLILAAVTAAATGNYRVVATNHFGMASSSNVQVTVNVPPQPVRWLTNQVVKAGQNVTLAYAVSGDQPMTYSWQFNGTPISWAEPVLVLTNIQAAEAGYYQVTATNDFGSNAAVAKISLIGPASRLVAWGDDSGGQTKVPAGLSNIVAAAAGDLHSMAVRANGSLFAWGNNASGQCDLPAAATNQPLAVAAGDAHSLALLANGTVVAWGDDTFGQTNVPADLTNVVAITAGDFNTLALRANGTVVGWGDNSYGEDTIPANATNTVGIVSGYYHSLALISSSRPTVMPQLRVQMVAHQLRVHWQGGVLQWAPAPTGPFTDASNQGNGDTNTDLSVPAKYLRLRY